MNVVLSVISAIFWGAILLSVLVFIHEGGHYLAARATGMRVSEFFLGMPCKAKLSFLSKTRGTEIGVTPILVGGYTKICGMEGTPSQRCDEVLAYVANHGVARPEDIAASLDMDFDDVISDLDVLIDWGSLMSAQIDTHDLPLSTSDPLQNNALLPERKAISYSVGDDGMSCSALALTAKRDKDLKCILDKGHNFEGETTQAGQAHGLAGLTIQEFFAREKKATYLGKGFLARVFALIAGPAVNIITGILGLAITISVIGTLSVVDIATISSVTEGSIAAEAGMQAGDSFVSIAGTPVSSWIEFSEALTNASQLNEPFEIVYTHAGDTTENTFEVDPVRLRQEGYLGVYATTETVHPSLFKSLQASWTYFTMTAQYVVRLFEPAHTAEVVSQSSSVIGISVMASQAAQTSIPDFVYLLAAVSLSLGLMNLIPIPPLDGGKLLIEIVQLVLRRPLSEKAQLRFSYFGLVLMLTLFIFVLRNDIFTYVLGG